MVSSVPKTITPPWLYCDIYIKHCCVPQVFVFTILVDTCCKESFRRTSIIQWESEITFIKEIVNQFSLTLQVIYNVYISFHKTITCAMEFINKYKCLYIRLPLLDWIYYKQYISDLENSKLQSEMQLIDQSKLMIWWWRFD